MADKLFYNISETTRLLSLSRTQLYREARAGRLRLSKLAGRTLISAADLRAYADAARPAEPRSARTGGAR